MSKQTYETPQLVNFGDVRDVTQATSGVFTDSITSTQGENSLGTNTPEPLAEK